MRTAIVRASDVFAHNRMDAGFHIALATLRGRVEALRARHTDDEARALVASVPTSGQQGLVEIMRGAGRVDAAAAERAAREYPHLALAIVERDIGETVDRVQREIAAGQATLDDLLAIARGGEAG